MIGNDIVDLKQMSTQFYWQRKRYLDKVFTAEEQSLIAAHENHHQMFWLLWSMKETAYKSHVQKYGKRFFNPKQLVCKYEITSGFGSVNIGQYRYRTKSQHSKDYVYSVTYCAKDDIESTLFKLGEQTYKAQSSHLKQTVLQSISNRKQIPVEQLCIKTSQLGVPQVWNLGHQLKKLPIELTLTHCGRFSAFAIQYDTQ